MSDAPEQKKRVARPSLSLNMQEELHDFEVGSLNWVDIVDENKVVNELKTAEQIKSKKVELKKAVTKVHDGNTLKIEAVKAAVRRRSVLKHVPMPEPKLHLVAEDDQEEAQAEE